MPSKIKDEYKPRDTDSKIGYLIEECGEVLSACGKSVRWGLDSFNPELPPEKQEQNGEWILRELKDLKRAIRYVSKALKEEGY